MLGTDLRISWLMALPPWCRMPGMTRGGGNNDRNDRNMGTSIAIGVAIGAGIGVAIDKIALGVGIGIAIGVAIGAGLGNRGGRS